jgi:hypothetical protein
MKYPNLVYKCPGRHRCAGGTYTFRRVNNEKEFIEALSQKWFPTLPMAQNPSAESIEAFFKSAGVVGSDGVDKEAKTVQEDPTTWSRARLVEEAEKLGLPVARTVKRVTLAKRVKEALEG